jgi:F420-0:gamma-glutamyl ligase
MKVTAIQTPIVKPGEDLHRFLTNHLPPLPEKSFVVITSKIVSFAQNRLVPIEPDNPGQKHQLARQEADLYLDPSASRYNLMLTVKNSILAVNAGIDESNSQGHYLLWPENPQQTADELWQFLRRQFGVKELGVILTDSKTMPSAGG